MRTIKRYVLMSIVCVFAGACAFGPARAKADREVAEAKANVVVAQAAAVSSLAESASDGGPGSSSRYSIADVHFHLVDFLQRSDGIEAAVRAMDRTGVERAAISGMPVVKKWNAADPRRPLYYLEDDAPAYWYSATDVLVARAVESLSEDDRARFHPFICGFNGTDMNAVDHIKRMIEWYPGLWHGIGEVMGRHDDLTALTYGETARADHPALDIVYDFAAENDLPVLVHQNISSVRIREPLYLHEMENAVRDHPKTRFIWAHCGISRRIEVPTLTQEIRRMLRTYPNLWADLSWVVFEEYICPDGVPSPDWVAMLNEFPDRFIIGSDKVAKFDNLEDEIWKYNVLLDALEPATASKIAHENFIDILPAAVRDSIGR